MPSNPAERLASYENILWAWLKLTNYYRRSEVWYDELELARFELRLDQELADLSEDLRSGRYATRPVRPMPYPKRNAKGDMEVRQFFWVELRDQLAWLAYLNLVGAEIDLQMPSWSYGNRLFRALIVDQPTAEDIPRFTSGPYRNTRSQIYRPFKQSWPLYRRHVLLALKSLRRPSLKVSYDAREQQLLDTEKSLRANERLIYLRRDFWDRHSRTVYWCSFDIEKFYPSVTLDRVRDAMVARSDTVRLLGGALLESLTHFEIDYSGWAKSDLQKLGMTGETTVAGIPTGLIAAGFLANVAMLPVDDWVATETGRRQVAHFRYVDDHIIVAPSFDSLSTWYFEYQEILQSRVGCKIKEDKTEPEQFRTFVGNPKSRKRKTDAMQKTWVDPAFPSPLMTKTLEKVSDLANTNFDLQDREEQRRILNDLEHLLLAPLPEEELPEKTRVTFSATLLARFAAQAEHKNADLLSALLEQHTAARDVSNLERELRNLRRSSKISKQLRATLPADQKRVTALTTKIAALRQNAENRRDRLNRRITAVLLKALELHPEKLRMWERVLEFCRRTGGSATTINDSLRKLRRDHPLAYTYVSARVLQVLARQSVVSLNDYFNANLNLDRRLHAASFLSSIPLAMKRLRMSLRRDYVRHAHALVTLALSFANFAVRAIPRLTSLPAKPGIRLRSALYQSHRFNFAELDGPATWWTIRNFSIWAYPEANVKSIEAGLQALPAQDPTSWKIWRYLGFDVPLQAFRLVAEAHAVTTGSEGWIAEALHSKPTSSVRRLKSVHGPVGRVARALIKKPRRRLLLPDWIVWTNSSERDPFDPRLSEWTALEITVQASIFARRYSAGLRREVLSSTFNFAVPESWIKNPSECVTWEGWKRRMSDQGVAPRGRLRLHDSRVRPSVSDFPELDIEYGSVRALAILLLALLRRDFRLPNHLLPIGYHGLLSKAAIAHIQSRPCSSRTMAILESCLMDRSIETLWMKESDDNVPQRLEQDIATDIPVILNIGQLIDALRTAQETLSRYQLTVSAHQPRQLIPVYLEQYTKENWHMDTDDGQEDEIE